MRRPLMSLVVALVAPLTAAAAQSSGDRWQTTMADQSIVWDFRIVKLDGESLVVRQRDSVFNVPIQRIQELRMLKKSSLQFGTGAGGGMSALMGGDDEVYDLGQLEFPERLRMLQQILLTHPAASP